MLASCQEWPGTLSSRRVQRFGLTDGEASLPIKEELSHIVFLQYR
jgi:hypothetical protein